MSPAELQTSGPATLPVVAAGTSRRNDGRAQPTRRGPDPRRREDELATSEAHALNSIQGPRVPLQQLTSELSLAVMTERRHTTEDGPS